MAHGVTIGIRDSEGKISNMVLHAADGVDLAADSTAASAIATLVAALTEGVVASVSLNYQVDSETAVPAGNIDNEIKAAFGFLTTDNTTARVSIPAFDRTKLVPNTDQVDREDSDVAAFVAAMLGYEDYRGGGFESLKYAVEAYGRRQR
jgi:NADPH-dependent ferric siderophore reductase